MIEGGAALCFERQYMDSSSFANIPFLAFGATAHVYPVS
jgi:hypothetical protein